MQFIAPVIQFLKKHYEKIILCVVLLGLAVAAIWMGKKITAMNEEASQPMAEPAGAHSPVAPMDLSADMALLSQVTNPPPVVLSGDHNLFNSVTWRRKPNGDLLKILKTGPDALTITNIVPLYTEVGYDHPTGNGAIYVMSLQVHSAKRPPEYAKVDETTKSGLYIIRGIKGASDNPDALELEIPATGETNIWVSPGNPYRRVDGYMADLKYDPESRVLPKQRVNDTITLDKAPYKIIEITNDAVRVQSIENTKVTTIKWNGNP
jgi:hypothetical protein